jgi:hypothetical protein
MADDRQRERARSMVLAAAALIGIFFPFFLGGCSQSPGYSIAYVNKTGRDLSNVYVFHGTNQIFGCGRLVKDGESTEGTYRRAFPSPVEVRWEDGSRTKTAEIKLDSEVRNKLPDGWRIYFVFSPDGSVAANVVQKRK